MYLKRAVSLDHFIGEINDLCCVKSARIWNFSGPHFPAFGLNTERYSGYSTSLRVHSKCGKIQTRKTPNMDTFLALSGDVTIQSHDTR